MPTDSAADRVLLLLKVLENTGPLRVREAAQYLEVTDPTAHRLLSALRRHGYAIQDASRAYHPAPRPGRTTGDETEIAVAAAPHATALCEATEETVHITRLQGRDIRFVLECPSPHLLRVGRRLGMVLPAHLTAGGLVMLAALPDDTLSTLYPRIPLTPAAQPDLPHLRRSLLAVRRNGYAINAERTEPGVNTIGVPLHDSAGLTSLALIIAAPRSRIPAGHLTRLLPQLTATAQSIQTAIAPLPPLPR